MKKLTEIVDDFWNKRDMDAKKDLLELIILTFVIALIL